MLTGRQAAVLRLIEETIAENGRSPSYREMGAQLGILSPSGVYKIVLALEERGFIRRTGTGGAARSIEVIKPQSHLNPEYLRGFQDGIEAAGKLNRNRG